MSSVVKRLGGVYLAAALWVQIFPGTVSAQNLDWAVSQMEAGVGATAVRTDGVAARDPGGIAQCGTVDIQDEETEAALDENRDLVPYSELEAKKIKIPVVFTVFYDPSVDEPWFNDYFQYVRDYFIPDPSVQESIPNIGDARVVDEESCNTALANLNAFYGKEHIEFVLYDGDNYPEDTPEEFRKPIRQIPDATFAIPYAYSYQYWDELAQQWVWNLDYMSIRRDQIAVYGVDYPNVLNIFVHLYVEVGGPLGYSGFPQRVYNPDETGDTWAITVDFRTMPKALGHAREQGLLLSDYPNVDPGPKAKDYSSITDIPDYGYLSFAEYQGTLEHEVGHALGLYHTFNHAILDKNTFHGGAGTEGDRVSDTPEELIYFRGDGLLRNQEYEEYLTLVAEFLEYFWGVEGVGWYLGRNTIDDSYYWQNHKDPADPITNIMDYGNFHISQRTLTKGQAERIRRMVAVYMPQFLDHYKYEKPRPEALIAYADFEDEDLSDDQVTNKAKHGQHIPIYVRALGDNGYAERLDEVDGWPYTMSRGSVLNLQDAYLEIKTQDLEYADLPPRNDASTIAMWVNIDPEGTVNPEGQVLQPIASLTGETFPFSQDLYMCPNFDPDYFGPGADLGYMGLNVIHHVDETAIWSQPGTGFFGPHMNEAWIHVAIVQDSGYTYIYVDGYLYDWNAVETGGPLEGIRTIQIGFSDNYNYAGLPGAAIFGQIDDLAIYGVALNPDEIMQLAILGADGKDLQGCFRDGVGLEIYPKSLDELENAPSSTLLLPAR